MLCTEFPFVTSLILIRTTQRIEATGPVQADTFPGSKAGDTSLPWVFSRQSFTKPNTPYSPAVSVNHRKAVEKLRALQIVF